MARESAARAPASGEDRWYEPLLDLLPAALLLVAPETGRVLFANQAAHRMAGGSFPLARATEDHPRVYRLRRGGRTLRPEEYPAARAARGERVENMQLDWPTPHGTRTVVSAAATIDVPGAGRITAVTLEDVTDLERARRRADALAEAGAVLGTSLDFDATLHRIAHLAVPRLADWCFVELLRDDGTIERVAIAAGDPALLETARDYDRRYPLDPDSPVGSPKVIRSGEPELTPEIPDAMLEAAAEDADHLEILRGLGFRSSMIVPLRSGGRVLGDIALVSAASGRRFGEGDLAAAQELADRCGLYLENARLYRELRLARDELEAILAGIPDAVTVQGPDGRLVYVNDAAVRLLGHATRESLLAADPRSLVPSELHDEQGDTIPLDRLPGRRALAGEEPPPMILRWTPAPSARPRWSRLQARPLRGRDGATLAVNVIEDITELKEREATQRVLAEAGRVLAGSLDYEETLRRVARIAVPSLADWCMVDLVEDAGLRRVAVAHADPADAELAAAMKGIAIDGRGKAGSAAAVRTGRRAIYEHVDDALIASAALSRGHPAAARRAAMTSAVVVPMTVRGQRLGAITFATGDGRRLGPEDVAVLDELARRAAVAVDSARVHRQRSEIARTLQASLLPPGLPEIPGIETGALYRAAGGGTDVGGDFYDVFSIAEDAWFAVIGDVCGKGAEAAAVTALARYTIRAAAVRRRSPAAILRWLNDAMRRQDLGGRFCTIACVHLDLARPTIRATVACGGHPPPLLRRASGEIAEVGVAGTLLGLVDDPVVEDRQRDLRAGDALVLYTDGVTDAGAPDRLLRTEDLAAALTSGPREPAQRIVEHLGAVAVGKDGAAPRDDIAILALRARG
ncbi:MAG TPA: SpoIIE family protein phosphatase [Solirubrobacteraceae bacterium]|nr:SpoIIE family protein phosphatase [Solirubrobacteraceae bacterium]